MSLSTKHSSARDTASGEMSTMSKKLVRELHIDANASLGGGSSPLKRKRRSLKIHDDGGGGGGGGGGEGGEQEGDPEAKEQGQGDSSLLLTPPSSHNTTSPRNTIDLPHSPNERIKNAVNSTGESRIAQLAKARKEGNEMRDEIALSSEASSLTKQEGVNDGRSHKPPRKITDFFRKTPKAATATTTTTITPVASTTPTATAAAAAAAATMSMPRANSATDEDKFPVSLANTTSHLEEDDLNTDLVSSGDINHTQPVAKTDEGVKKQSRKDSVSSSSSALAPPRMPTAPSLAKTMGSPSTASTIVCPSLRSKSTAPASQTTNGMTSEMTTEMTVAPPKQVSNTRRASVVSSTGSATSSESTDDHHHLMSGSTSDAEHENQESNPALTAKPSLSRRASRMSNLFINTKDAKPAIHTAHRKSNPELESSESDESGVDDQVFSRKRKPGIVCADTMIKNWKRYGYESAKDARKQVDRILAKADAKHSNEDREDSSPQEGDGVEKIKVRRQARKGTVRVETMIKNWQRYKFANAAEARAVSNGLSADSELGLDEIATRLEKHKVRSHIEQIDDTQPNDDRQDDLSEDKLGKPALDTLTPKIDPAAPTAIAEMLPVETKTSQPESSPQSHDDTMTTVTSGRAARVLKQLEMNVSPGIFGSPSDATGRRSRERKRKVIGDGADADVEVLPITASATAAMGPPPAKRIKVASPLAPDLTSTRKTTPKPAQPPTSDPTTTRIATPTLAQPATPDGKPSSPKASSINLPNPSPLRNSLTASPEVAVYSFTPINQLDKKTAKKQKELDRLRMDVAPGIFGTKSASPRSSRGERKRDANVDLDLPIAPATILPVKDKNCDEDQDEKNSDRTDKDKDEKKQTQSLKRTNSASVALRNTASPFTAPPPKRLKLTFGNKKSVATLAPSPALTANPSPSTSATPSQQQKERQVLPLPVDLIGNGPIPRFIRAKSTTPLAVAVDCEHSEKGWMVINPVYVNNLYDYLHDLDTEDNEDEEDHEVVQAKDNQGEKHDEIVNATQADLLTTEQEKDKESTEKEWGKVEADVAEINKRMLKEVEMIMNWSIMTDAEKKDAGIAH